MCEAGPVEPVPPLGGEIDADVAIVGGGYAGMWTALALRRLDPGARVALLEAGICGAGPSGRNAGFANCFWHLFDRLEQAHGREAALDLCDLAAESVDAIGDFALERELQIGYRKAGHLKVATTASQDASWLAAQQACERAGRGDEIAALDVTAVRARCDSPLFRGGSFVRQGASVQPALLARGLRDAVIEAGVTLGERTRARRIESRFGDVLIETDGGARVRAGAAAVAINAASAGLEPLRPRLAVTSTHMIATEPVPDLLERIGWTGGECVSTARRHLHYFRTTADGRIAFGWGGGRLAYGARLGGRVEVDPAVVERLRADILRFFPGLRGRRVDAAWGGPVDVSPTHLPGVGTVPGSRIHYVCGFTGNGVAPAHLAGATLASLALGRRDRLTESALIEPEQPPVPPEPARFIGGSLVRAALVREEDADDRGRHSGALTRFLIDLPARLGFHVGR